MHLKYKDTYTLSEEQYREQAEPILRKVFVDDDPFGESLHENIREREILYPIWTTPEDDLLEAIFYSAREVGDIGCYLTNKSCLSNRDGEANHCYISLNNLEGFLKDQLLVSIFFESVIYSASGAWGLMISHEHHGVLGGSKDFMKSMKRFIPDLETQIHTWLLYFMEDQEARKKNQTGSLTLDWMPRLLSHVYGTGYALSLLKQYSFLKATSAKEYLEDYSPALMKTLMKVFKDCIFPIGGASSCPFQDAIEARAFLFARGSQPFWDNPIFWNALSSAILELGDTDIFEIDTVDGYYDKHSLTSDKVLPNLYTLERVICSLQGNWGILFDIEGIGLIGGPTSFIENIRKDFPEIDDQFSNLLTSWKSSGSTTDNEWLPDTLIHIFGEAKGKEFLSEARMMGVYKVSESS